MTAFTESKLMGEDLHNTGVELDQVEKIKADYRVAGLSATDTAVLDFAVKLTLHPSRMETSDLDVLRKEGFSDVALLEIVHITGYFNYINRVADALGVDPERERGGPSTFNQVTRINTRSVVSLRSAIILTALLIIFASGLVCESSSAIGAQPHSRAFSLRDLLRRRNGHFLQTRRHRRSVSFQRI